MLYCFCCQEVNTRKRLMDISGNTNSFQENESWQGKVFLSDDLSFEGIVINKE